MDLPVFIAQMDNIATKMAFHALFVPILIVLAVLMPILAINVSPLQILLTAMIVLNVLKELILDKMGFLANNAQIRTVKFAHQKTFVSYVVLP
jgi:hypothetical protein